MQINTQPGTYSPSRKSPPPTRVVSDTTTTRAWTRIRNNGCVTAKTGQQMKGNKNQLIESEIQKGQVIFREGKAWCYGHGGFVEIEMLEADHMQPKNTQGNEDVLRNGENVTTTESGVEDIANKWLLCRRCNGAKTSKHPLPVLKDFPDFGDKFLKEMAYHREDSLLAFSQQQNIGQIQALTMEHNGESWDIESFERSDRRAKIKISLEDEISLIIRQYFNGEVTSMPHIPNTDELKAIYQPETDIVSFLKGEGTDQIPKVKYSGKDWEVLSRDDSEERFKLVIQSGTERKTVRVYKDNDELTIDNKSIQNPQVVRASYLLSEPLKDFLLGEAREIKMIAYHNHQWFIKSRNDSDERVKFEIESDTSDPFYIRFYKESASLDVGEYALVGDRDIKIVFPVDRGRPLTFYKNENGILCSRDGVPLGKEAVDYYNRTHMRKVTQKTTAEMRVFSKLEDEIDQRNRAKYQEQGAPQEIERKLFATDKKIELLSEAAKQEDLFISDSDDDDDLDEFEKKEAFKRASQDLLNRLKAEYRQKKLQVRAEREEDEE